MKQLKNYSTPCCEQSTIGCPKCKIRFTDYHNMRRHFRREHSKAKPFSFECSYPKCSKTYSTQSNLDRHKKTHASKKDFVCAHPDCKFATNERNRIVLHEQKHLRDEETLPAGEKKFYCSKLGCTCCFASKSHNQATNFNCSFFDCNEKFDSFSCYKEHRKTHIDPTDENGLFICQFPNCPKKFDLIGLLDKHVIKHKKN